MTTILRVGFRSTDASGILTGGKKKNKKQKKENK